MDFDIAMEDIPTHMKNIRGNRTLHSYIEAFNKMAMDDIFMHHRSSRVFGIMENCYNMTIDLRRSVEFNFGILSETEQLLTFDD